MANMNEKLIYDVGMHLGEDAEFYLSKGYKVIAIDADPNLIKLAKSRFASDNKLMQIQFLNYAICDVDDTEFKFHLSEESIWNSLNLSISNRLNKYKESIIVTSKTLPSLFHEFGTPFYCKVDIEGTDEKCLLSLTGIQELPAFLSCESECVGENQTLTDPEALSTLNILKDLGYSKFKLVDQLTLIPLAPNKHFYKEEMYIQPKIGLLQKIKNKIIKKKQEDYHNYLSGKFSFKFKYGSSGPFGDDIEGEWVSYLIAKEMLLFHRNDYFGLSNSNSFGFWCDWHASRL